MRRATLYAALTYTTCSLLNAHAGEPGVARENELKAAYVFNFAKFIEWPPTTPPDSLTICVVDAVGMREALAASTADKRIAARHIVVRSLAASGPADGCDVIYFDAPAAAALKSLGDSANTHSLTVSDAPGFTSRGGMIEMYSEGNRIRFNINIDNARRAGLKISSGLLQLASKVE